MPEGPSRSGCWLATPPFSCQSPRAGDGGPPEGSVWDVAAGASVAWRWHKEPLSLSLRGGGRECLDLQGEGTGAGPGVHTTPDREASSRPSPGAHCHPCRSAVGAEGSRRASAFLPACPSWCLVLTQMFLILQEAEQGAISLIFEARPLIEHLFI